MSASWTVAAETKALSNIAERSDKTFGYTLDTEYPLKGCSLQGHKDRIHCK